MSVKFIFNLSSDNASVATRRGAEREVSRLLVLCANRVKEGYPSGTLGDINGNTICSWSLTFEKEEGDDGSTD